MSEVGPVSQEELRAICEFLYRRTGMLFGEAKRYYVQRRISERMDALRIASFRTYFSYLRSDADGEVEKFINCLLYTSPSPRDRTRSRMPSSA